MSCYFITIYPKIQLALVANDPIISGTLIQLFRQFENQNPSSNSWDNFLILILATREVVVPLENDPIISGTSICLFRHLEHQNLFKGWDIFLVSFLTTREAVAPLANYSIMLGTLIQSFRYHEHQNPSSNGWDNV